MFILTSLTLPLAAWTAFSRIGVSCLHGPHHGAQKSISTGWRLRLLDHVLDEGLGRRLLDEIGRRRRSANVLNDCHVVLASGHFEHDLVRKPAPTPIGVEGRLFGIMRWLLSALITRPAP